MASDKSSEPLSPELILVSPPEEAQLARERLADDPAADWDRFLASVRAEPAPPQDLPTTPEGVSGPRRRVGRRLVMAAIVIALIAAVLGIAWARDRRAQRATAPAPAHVSRPAHVTTTGHVSARASKRARRKPAAPKRAKTVPKRTVPKRSVTTPTRSHAAHPGARPAPPVRPARPPTSGFVPSRVWSWAPAPGSIRYLVRFFRNGRQVLAARTRAPHLVLAKNFRFRGGRYRWTVVAMSGAKARRAIVDSTFVVSAAAAARANGRSAAGR